MIRVDDLDKTKRLPCPICLERGKSGTLARGSLEEITFYCRNCNSRLNVSQIKAHYGELKDISKV